MRIVHVTPGYWPGVGGTETHVQRVSEGLAARGHHVTVLTIRGHGATEALAPLGSELVNSVHVIRFAENVLLERLVRLRGAYRLLGALKRQHQARMILRGPLSLLLFLKLLRCNADIVGVFGWAKYLLPWKVCLAKRIRRWQVVGIPLFHTEEAWSREAVFPPLVSLCDAIITNTDHEKQFVEEHVSRQVRILVGGVGIDSDAFSGRDAEQIRTRYHMGTGPVVGYVGRMVASKGVAELIKAMRVVWRWHPDALLVLAGPPPRGKRRADRRVVQTLSGLSAAERAHVLLLGEFHERDKASLFESFDVFAMPSTGESFGIAYLEAWMCRKPVIGASVGSTPSVIRDGVDGFLVDPNDPRQIGQAIVRLLNDPAERARLGQAGHVRTMAEFTWERVVDRIEGLYEELRCSAPSPRSATASRSA